MKISYTIILSMLLALVSVAQDKIVLQSGEVLYGKVEEVGVTEVKYKKQDNPTGPVYSVAKADVYAIHYENGTKDEFAKKEEKKDDDYVKQDDKGGKQNTEDDDVYSNGKDHKKGGKKDHPHTDRVQVVVPVWHAIGWIILADILFGGCL